MRVGIIVIFILVFLCGAASADRYRDLQLDVLERQMDETDRLYEKFGHQFDDLNRSFREAERDKRLDEINEKLDRLETERRYKKSCEELK